MSSSLLIYAITDVQISAVCQSCQMYDQIGYTFVPWLINKPLCSLSSQTIGTEPLNVNINSSNYADVQHDIHSDHGEIVGILVKYELVDIQSTTNVLTNIYTTKWESQDSPPSPLTGYTNVGTISGRHGTYGGCDYSGLEVQYQPINTVSKIVASLGLNATDNDTPETNLYTAEVNGEIITLNQTNQDGSVWELHKGCGECGNYFLIYGFYNIPYFTTLGNPIYPIKTVNKTSILNKGDSLYPGQYLANSEMFAYVDLSGQNFTIANDTDIFWNVYNPDGHYIYFNTIGNLCFVNNDNSITFIAVGIANANSLVLEYDGSLNIIDSAKNILWNSTTADISGQPTNILLDGQNLNEGESLHFNIQNIICKAVMDAGNFELHDNNGEMIWNLDASTNNNNYLYFSNGNICIKDNNNTDVACISCSNPNTFLVLLDNADLQIQDFSGNIVWSYTNYETCSITNMSNIMSVGSTLVRGTYIQNGNYKAMLDEYGYFKVVDNTGENIYYLDSQGAGNTLQMTSNGLVLLDSNNQEVSLIRPFINITTANTLNLTEQGILNILDNNSKILWSSENDNPTYLSLGQSITYNEDYNIQGDYLVNENFMAYIDPGTGNFIIGNNPNYSGQTPKPTHGYPSILTMINSNGMGNTRLYFGDVNNMPIYMGNNITGRSAYNIYGQQIMSCAGSDTFGSCKTFPTATIFRLSNKGFFEFRDSNNKILWPGFPYTSTYQDTKQNNKLYNESKIANHNLRSLQTNCSTEQGEVCYLNYSDISNSTYDSSDCILECWLPAFCSYPPLPPANQKRFDYYFVASCLSNAGNEYLLSKLSYFTTLENAIINTLNLNLNSNNSPITVSQSVNIITDVSNAISMCITDISGMTGCSCNTLDEHYEFIYGILTAIDNKYIPMLCSSDLDNIEPLVNTLFDNIYNCLNQQPVDIGGVIRSFLKYGPPIFNSINNILQGCDIVSIIDSVQILLNIFQNIENFIALISGNLIEYSCLIVISTMMWFSCDSSTTNCLTRDSGTVLGMILSSLICDASGIVTSTCFLMNTPNDTLMVGTKLLQKQYIQNGNYFLMLDTDGYLKEFYNYELIAYYGNGDTSISYFEIDSNGRFNFYDDNDINKYSTFACLIDGSQGEYDPGYANQTCYYITINSDGSLSIYNTQGYVIYTTTVACMY